MIYSDCFSPSSFWPLSVLVFWSFLGSRTGVRSIGFSLTLLLSLFSVPLVILSPPEETKSRLTGYHTCTSTRAGAWGSLVRARFAAFVFGLVFSSPFYDCASSVAFWLKERFEHNRFRLTPSLIRISGLTFLLRPSSVFFPRFPRC